MAAAQGSQLGAMAAAQACDDPHKAAPLRCARRCWSRLGLPGVFGKCCRRRARHIPGDLAGTGARSAEAVGDVEEARAPSAMRPPAVAATLLAAAVAKDHQAIKLPIATHQLPGDGAAARLEPHQDVTHHVTDVTLNVDEESPWASKVRCADSLGRSPLSWRSSRGATPRSCPSGASTPSRSPVVAVKQGFHKACWQVV